jgi:hypothetical protein
LPDLWGSDDATTWQAALDRYEAEVARQGSARLPEHDRWFRTELPAALRARQPPGATLDELARATEWKMLRGVWRARNLQLVRSNDPALVERVSRDALARVPDPLAPIRKLSELSGVGPATASAIASAYAPEAYPFFDEVAAAQVPGLGAVDFTLKYYAGYAAALRSRAAALGDDWTPALVERALWSNAGGKAGNRI